METTRVPERTEGRRVPASRGRLAIVVVGVLFAIVAAACSSNQETRKNQQNATQWGTAICSVAEAKDATAQQQAVGQAKHYSDLAVQMIDSMKDGAAQIDALVDTLDADVTAKSVRKIVPDLRAIQEQASSLAKQSDGDESESWDKLSGTVSNCVAQLPPNLQGN